MLCGIFDILYEEIYEKFFSEYGNIKKGFLSKMVRCKNVFTLRNDEHGIYAACFLSESRCRVFCEPLASPEVVYLKKLVALSTRSRLEMLYTMSDDCKQHGIKYIIADAHLKDAKLKQFYTNNGFNEKSMRKDFMVYSKEL